MIFDKENTATPLATTTDTALTEIAGPGNKKKQRQGGKVATRVRAAKRNHQGIGDLESLLRKQLDDDAKVRKKEADEWLANAAFRGESDKARIRKLERENKGLRREKEWLQEIFLKALDLSKLLADRRNADLDEIEDLKRQLAVGDE